MEIRLADKKDFALFYAIKKEFYEEYSKKKKPFEFSQSDFQELLKDFVIIAIEDCGIIGLLVGEIRTEKNELEGYIAELFVKKEFRKKHIATKLKNYFLKILKNKEICLCRIDVNPDNPAQEVYKKWGFKIDKYRMSYNL